VIFLFDESSSMSGHAEALIKLFDNEVKFLAAQSKDLNQETRVSVYVFSSRGTARCLIYDMDVLRLPSLKGLYKPSGMTALCEATVLALQDLEMTPQKYGQHSFWLLGFTDGFENASAETDRQKMPVMMGNRPDNWTTSIFVPDQISKKYAVDWGFPKDNIAIWDTTSVRGVEDMAQTVRQASTAFFNMRASGGRGTKSIFSLNTLSTDEIKKLNKIQPHEFRLLSVAEREEIKPFITRRMGSYHKGTVYYELVKNEKVQADKSIIVYHNGGYYSGAAARQMLGLPSEEVLVKAEAHPEYTIYIQSNSVNRNLIPNQKVIVLTGPSNTYSARTMMPRTSGF